MRASPKQHKLNCLKAWELYDKGYRGRFITQREIAEIQSKKEGRVVSQSNLAYRLKCIKKWNQKQNLV